MENGLYQAVLQRVRLTPHVEVRREYFTDAELTLRLPRGIGTLVFEWDNIHCCTTGEIIVDFDTRKRKVFGCIPWSEKPLASLDEIRRELAYLSEIGEPLIQNSEFLVYERKIGRRVSHSLFDLVVVGRRSFLAQYSEATISFGEGGLVTYKELEIDTSFAEQVNEAHVAMLRR